jgi:DTW domain-containing protein YfiP
MVDSFVEVTQATRGRNRPLPVASQCTWFYHDARQVAKANAHVDKLHHAIDTHKRCERCWMMVLPSEPNHCVCDRILHIDHPKHRTHNEPQALIIDQYPRTHPPIQAPPSTQATGCIDDTSSTNTHQKPVHPHQRYTGKYQHKAIPIQPPPPPPPAASEHDDDRRRYLHHQVLLHMHYAELQRLSSNTAKILPLALPFNCQLFISDIIADDERLERVIKSAPSQEHVIILFPSPDSITVSELKQKLYNQQHGNNNNNPNNTPAITTSSCNQPPTLDDFQLPPLYIVVLDGTWSTARVLNRRLPSSLTRVRLSIEKLNDDEQLLHQLHQLQGSDTADDASTRQPTSSDSEDIRRFGLTRKVCQSTYLSSKQASKYAKVTRCITTRKHAKRACKQLWH